MITPIILASVATLFCIIMLLRRKRPIIKKSLALTPGYSSSLCGGVFCLFCEKIRLIFLKDQELRIFINNESIVVLLKQKVNKYFVYNDRMIYQCEDYKIIISNTGIQIIASGEVDFAFTFTKPKFMYSLNLGQGKISLGDKDPFILRLSGMQDSRIKDLGNGTFSFCTVINDHASITFSRDLASPKGDKLTLLKKELFGTYDIAEWEIVPRFNKVSYNKLQVGYLKKLLSVDSRKIKLPCLAFCETKGMGFEVDIADDTYINLDWVGFSKLVLLKSHNKTATLLDLLAGLEYQIKYDKKCDFEIINYWGTLYLAIYPGQATCRLNILPLYKSVQVAELCTPLLDCTSLLQGVADISINSVLERLNILVLHGYFVDIKKLIKDLNIHFLPQYTRFLLSNLVLSHILVFGERSLLRQDNIKRLLASNLRVALSYINPATFCFLKKFLPHIDDKALYNTVLNVILEHKGKFKAGNYEFFMTEILGLRVIGRKVFISPSKRQSLEASLWIRNKHLILRVNKDWQIIKINDINLYNVDCFEINSLDNETIISFE